MTAFGTCKTCSFWGSHNGPAWLKNQRECHNHDAVGSSDADDGLNLDYHHGLIFTGPDFGCIHHEVKS